MDGALSFAQALLRILAEISAGVVLGQIIEALGWTDRLGAAIRPLLAVGRLPRR